MSKLTDTIAGKEYRMGAVYAPKKPGNLVSNRQFFGVKQDRFQRPYVEYVLVSMPFLGIRTCALGTWAKWASGPHVEPPA